MPELRTELHGHLDVGDVVQTLIRDAQALVGDLGAIGLPIGASDLSSVLAQAQAIDGSDLSGTVVAIAGAIEPLLASVPGIAQIVGPLEQAIQLAESVHFDQFPAELQQLVTRIEQELQGSRDGGFVGVLLRIVAVVKNSPQGGLLAQLLGLITRAGGVDLPAMPSGAQKVLPAALAALELIGGLMSLETVLGEGDRLAGTLVRRLDPELLQSTRTRLLSQLSEATSAASAADAAFDSGAPELGPVIAKAVSCANDFDALFSSFVESLAFGEASLAVLDVDGRLQKIQIAAALSQRADVDAIEQALRTISDPLERVIEQAIAGPPIFSLQDLFTRVESEVDSLADQIRALDVSALSAPVAEALHGALDVIDKVGEVIATVTLTIRGVLEQIRAGIAALPVASIANGIHDFLAPVAEALRFIGGLVETAREALDGAAHAATQALAGLEGLIDDFTGAISSQFAAADAFVTNLHLEQVIGSLTGEIEKFAAALSKAQMKPYFDTASDAIATAADVISAVPFDLLPSSMKSEVDAAVKPVKDVDVAAVEAEIVALFEIGPDGKSSFHRAVEQALSEVQTTYNDLIKDVEGLDLPARVRELDTALAGIASDVHGITPNLALQPIQDAIDQVRDRISAFDVHAVLGPINAAFAQVLAFIDQYDPSLSLAALAARVRTVREAALSTIKLRSWGPSLDLLATRAEELIAGLDPVALEPAIRSALAELVTLLEQTEFLRGSAGLRSIIMALLTGTGLSIDPFAFDVVLGWLAGDGGSAALAARAERIADNVLATQAAVAAVDPQPFASSLLSACETLKSALEALEGRLSGSLPRAAERQQVLAVVGRLQAANAVLGPLLSNRARYQAELAAAAISVQALRRTGLSQVDQAVLRLQTATTPARVFGKFVRIALGRIGLTGTEGGIIGVFRALIAVASPERLTRIAMPLFRALRERLIAVVHGLLDPIKTAVARLNQVADTLDLEPLVLSVRSVHDELKAQLELLSPDHLLGEALTAFDAAQAEVAGFDPLREVSALLDALKATVERVLGKLSAEQLLGGALDIYNQVLALLRSLHPTELVEPVLTSIDDIIAQVSTGLAEIVPAFQDLQAALPGDGGGSGASASLSLGAG